MPLLWLAAPPKIFRSVPIEDIDLASWATTLLMVRKSKSALKAMHRGELKEYMETKKSVLLGTTLWPPNCNERAFYRNFEEYILFKLSSGADWVITHTLPVFDDDSDGTEKAKIRMNMKIISEYIRLRDRYELDVGLIAVPYARSWELYLCQVKMLAELGVDAIGVSVASWIEKRGGLPSRSSGLKNAIFLFLRSLKERTYKRIIVLGSQEPNLARRLYWGARILTFEGSFIVMRSFPSFNRMPLMLEVHNGKAIWVPVLTSKNIPEANPRFLLRYNIKKWINYVLLGL